MNHITTARRNPPSRFNPGLFGSSISENISSSTSEGKCSTYRTAFAVLIAPLGTSSLKRRTKPEWF
jgi:hypothetical protein